MLAGGASQRPYGKRVLALWEQSPSARHPLPFACRSTGAMWSLISRAMSAPTAGTPCARTCALLAAGSGRPSKRIDLHMTRTHFAVFAAGELTTAAKNCPERRAPVREAGAS